jgi:hypothetical protein
MWNQTLLSYMSVGKVIPHGMKAFASGLSRMCYKRACGFLPPETLTSFQVTSDTHLLKPLHRLSDRTKNCMFQRTFPQLLLHVTFQRGPCDTEAQHNLRYLARPVIVWFQYLTP